MNFIHHARVINNAFEAPQHIYDISEKVIMTKLLLEYMTVLIIASHNSKESRSKAHHFHEKIISKRNYSINAIIAIKIQREQQKGTLYKSRNPKSLNTRPKDPKMYSKLIQSNSFTADTYVSVDYRKNSLSRGRPPDKVMRSLKDYLKRLKKNASRNY